MSTTILDYGIKKSEYIRLSNDRNDQIFNESFLPSRIKFSAWKFICAKNVYGSCIQDTHNTLVADLSQQINACRI